MKKIKLSNARNTYVVVDDIDYKDLSKYKWHLKSGYAVRTYNYPMVNGSRPSGKTIRMHRQIMMTPEGMDTDHINGDKLDNRKCNLRHATRRQNSANQRWKGKYKGVYKHGKRWKVVIAHKYIGMFSSDIDAARAYNAAAVKMYGEFARLNRV